jgi:hypothetical protein
MFPDQFFFCMSTFSVRNGTARGSESLCDSCYWAHIHKGFVESEELVLCAFLRPARPVPFKVRHCTDYNDKRVSSKRDMEDIAWIIRTKDVNRRVGFSTVEEKSEGQAHRLEIVPTE